MTPHANPKDASLLPAKTAVLEPEQAICARARLGRDPTSGQVPFGPTEAARSHIWRTLARFSTPQVCNVKVKAQLFIVVVCLILSALHPVAGSGKGKPHRVECDVHKGPCNATLAGTEVTLDVAPKPVKAMKDLIFTVTFTDGKAVANPYIDLGMVGMNMGRNRVVLEPAGESVFRGYGVIVRCPSGRRTWRAELIVPERGSVEFIFDVIY